MTPVKFINPDENLVAGDSGLTIEASEITAEIEPGASTTQVEFKSKNPDHREEVGTVTVADVRIDRRVQRPENPRLTRKIGKNLVLAALGTVTISVRENQGPNGDETWFILLDGQQRMIGSRRAGYTGPINARFHFGLSLQEEAELFRLLNDKVDIPATDKYSVGLTEGLADVVQVQAILDELGISLGSNAGQFNAVVVGRRVVSMTDGPEHFRWALRTLREFYAQDEVPKYEGRLVEALARIRQRYGNQLNTKSLITKVLKQGGPIYILKLAKLKMDTNRTTAMVGTIEALLQTYNTYLQHKLPEWDRSKK